VIQMRDFLDYQAAAKKLNFTTIPFSKVKVIRYTRTDLAVAVEYGLTFDQNPLTPAAYDQGKKSGLRKQNDVTNDVPRLPFPVLTKLCPTTALAPQKVDDLKAMLKFMDEVDVQYYETLIKPQAHAL